MITDISKSTAVGYMSHDLEVVSSNASGCCTFTHHLLSSWALRCFFCEVQQCCLPFIRMIVLASLGQNRLKMAASRHRMLKIETQIVFYVDVYL